MAHPSARSPFDRPVREPSTLSQRVLGAAPGLSPRLRELADRMLSSPAEVADHGLRALALRWRVSAASLSRLARGLGLDGYDALRAACAREARHRDRVFAARARDVHRPTPRRAATGLLARHVEAAIADAGDLRDRIDERELAEAARRLGRARRVVLVGSLSSAALVDYLAYMGALVFGHWEVAGRGGSPLAAGIADLGPRDLVLLVSIRPYARATVEAARQALERRVPVIALTDAAGSPVADGAAQVFLLPAAGPHFLGSHVATLVILEALVAAAIRLRGRRALEHVERLERAYHDAGIYWETR